MKNSKLFKRSALLLSVIVLAVVLTVGAIAGVALLTGDGADYGEKYSGVNVSTSGKVSLKFYYSDLGSAEEMVAEITDPETGSVKTVTYAVAGLKTDNGYCVSVPLAPSEMTHSVKVYANGANGAGDSIVYSVKEYAQDVLADDDLSAYHDTMRALLNWGAMAQGRYGDATGTLANGGVFAKNTNPINAVETIAANEGSLANGTAITADRYTLSLEPDNLAIHFYVKYEGEGTLTATVNRAGLEAPVDTSVEKMTDGEYRIRISNVSAQLFATPYTVTVSDGSDTCTFTASVLENLSKLVAGDYDDATKNTAKAMYQFYQLATGNTGANECPHNLQTFWATEDAGSSWYKCASCFTSLSTVAIGNNVESYLSASELKYLSSDAWGNGTTFNKNIGVDADGTSYVRMDGYNRPENADEGHIDLYPNGNGEVTGQYMVIKVRYSSNNNNQRVSRIFASTTGSWGGVYFKVAEDGQWHTIVIDLASRINDANSFAPGEDGQYRNTYLGIRPFNFDFPADHSGSADYAYIAFCDDMEDLKGIIDSETYEMSVSAGASIKANTSNNTCIGYDGYNYNIKVDAVGAFMDPEYLLGRVAHDGGTSFAETTIVTDEGMPYVHMADAHTYGWGWGDLTLYDSGEYPTAGRYLVMKIRRPECDLNVNKLHCWITSAAGYTDAWDRGECSISLPEDNEWHTIVIDLGARSSAYLPDENGNYGPRTIHVRAFGDGADYDDTTNETLDIAYMAFCDDMSDLKGIISEETYEMSVDGNTNVKFNTSTNRCVGDHTYSAAEKNDDGIYQSTCSTCGYVYNYTTVANAAGVFMGPDYFNTERFINWSIAGNKYNEQLILTDKDENDMPYLHLEDANTGWGYVEHMPYDSDANPTAGRYLIMKLRRPDSDLNVSWIAFWVTSAAGYAENKYVNQFSINLPEDDQWHTIVIDLATRVSGYTADENDVYGPRSLVMRPFDGAPDYKYGETTNEALDIAYMAFCDDIRDLKGIISDETYELSVNNDTYYEYYTSNNKCAKHAYPAAQLVDGAYKTTCTICGNVYTYSVDAAAAGIFMDPGSLNNSGFISWSIAGAKYNEQLILTEENGMPYLHLEDAERSWGYVQHIPYDSGANPTAGRYFIMKVRRPECDLDVNHIEFYVTSAAGCTYNDKGEPIWDRGNFSVILPEDNEWHTIVIDLAARANGYIADTNGDYGPRTMYMRPFSWDNGGHGNTKNEAFDIAYMAFCDSMYDFKNIISDTTYEWSVDNDTNYEYYTSNNSCAHNIYTTQVVEGVNKRACAACGNVAYSYNVDASAGVFMGPDEINKTPQNGSAWHTTQTVLTEKDEDNNDMPYLHLEDAHRIWNQAEFSLYNTNANPSAGQYLVMKVRRPDSAMDLDKMFFWFNPVNTGDWPSFTVPLPEDNQWHTIVVDLSERADGYEYTGSNAPQTINVRAFGWDAGSIDCDKYSDEALDIAYVAICDSLNDLQNIISEDTYEWSVNNDYNEVKTVERTAAE